MVAPVAACLERGRAPACARDDLEIDRGADGVGQQVAAITRDAEMVFELLLADCVERAAAAGDRLVSKGIFDEPLEEAHCGDRSAQTRLRADPSANGDPSGNSSTRLPGHRRRPVKTCKNFSPRRAADGRSTIPWPSGKMVKRSG